MPTFTPHDPVSKISTSTSSPIATIRLAAAADQHDHSPFWPANGCSCEYTLSYVPPAAPPGGQFTTTGANSWRRGCAFMNRDSSVAQHFPSDGGLPVLPPSPSACKSSPLTDSAYLESAASTGSVINKGLEFAVLCQEP